MNFSTRMTRSVAIGMLAATAMLSIAPLAHAGNDKHRNRRYKGKSYSTPHQVQRSHYRVSHSHHSGAGPVLAGVLGGIILGSAIGNARSEPIVVRERVVVRESRHRYYDPYCENWYDNLDECRMSSRDHRHPRIIQVIDSRHDECVKTLRWHRGNWERTSDDWREWDD